MICSSCAWEADSIKGGAFTLAELDDLNARLSPAIVMGHANCEGCDCKHEPVGSCLPV